jgi:NAD(P)-dependent dehydrogenase (short-subunit alcohol dehydrogenase family)
VWKELLNVFEVAFKTFGRIDIVVANAGIGRTERIWESTLDDDMMVY